MVDFAMIVVGLLVVAWCWYLCFEMIKAIAKEDGPSTRGYFLTILGSGLLYGAFVIGVKYIQAEIETTKEDKAIQTTQPMPPGLLPRAQKVTPTKKKEAGAPREPSGSKAGAAFKQRANITPS